LPKHAAELLTLYVDARQAERDGTATDFQRRLIEVVPGILADCGL